MGSSNEKSLTGFAAKAHANNKYETISQTLILNSPKSEESPHARHGLGISKEEFEVPIQVLVLLLEPPSAVTVRWTFLPKKCPNCVR